MPSLRRTNVPHKFSVNSPRRPAASPGPAPECSDPRPGERDERTSIAAPACVSLPTLAPQPPSLRLPRSDGTELRAELCEFKGHAYVNLRVWFCGPDGQWHPTQRGVPLRLRELGRVAAALGELARFTGRDRPVRDEGER